MAHPNVKWNIKRNDRVYCTINPAPQPEDNITVEILKGGSNEVFECLRHRRPEARRVPANKVKLKYLPKVEFVTKDVLIYLRYVS